jgi:hypothetical protein
MNRLLPLVAGVSVVAALRADARACEPVGQFNHTVDPSMQATDQTPPTLPAIPAPVIHLADTSFADNGCGGAKCGDVNHIEIAAVATDDMTAPDRIGYRFALVDGALPANVALPTTAIEPLSGMLRIFFPDGTGAFDFTLEVVAIDLAGNESAPQSVRVRNAARRQRRGNEPPFALAAGMGTLSKRQAPGCNAEGSGSSAIT